MKRTYLVTGGAGFIGSNYIHYMFEKYGDSIQIINVDKLTYAGRLENLAEVEDRGNYRFIEADICDKEMIESLFSKYVIDRVVHFAAESHVDRSIDDPEIFVKTNVLGTAVLLNAARKAWEKEDGMYLENKKFLHVSTDEVYGSLGETGYFYETTPYAPHSPYSASKASADMLVRSYMDTYGFPANITNCSNNYGPRQFPEKLIPLIIKNALQGEKLPIYGDGLNVRDWLYVEDHVKAIDLVQEQGRLFETYNIGGHNEKTNLEIVNTILEVLRKALEESDPRKAFINDGILKGEAKKEKVVAEIPGSDISKALEGVTVSEQNNVSTVISAISEKSAELGFAYSSDVNRNEDVKVVYKVSKELTGDISYPIALVKAKADEDKAHMEMKEKLYKFLQTEDAKKVYEKYGFIAK